MIACATLRAADAPRVDTGTEAWMLTSTALVLLMLPGVAMLYGGLVRTKNVLGTMLQSFACMAVVGVLWVVCGYSQAFGKGALGGWCGWSRDLFFLSGVDEAIRSEGIPEYLYAMFQGKFAIITPALIAGAIAERVYFRSFCVFVALWSLLVYNPLCHWVWAPDGFLFNTGPKGCVDFAGGLVVHASAGFSALALALYLGARRGYPRTAMTPNNLVMALIGTGLLWVGWFGFNAGSAVASNLQTAQALTATQIAAAAGALTWVILEGLLVGKATTLGMCSGIIAGLAAITPAAGVAMPGGAIAIGIISAACVYVAIQVKNRLGYDDSLDAFGIHGVAGTVGVLTLSFFLRPSWLADASRLAGEKLAGATWTMWDQFLVQIEGAGITIVYAVVGTLILVYAIDKCMGFRVRQEEELAGIDHALHSEQAYGMLTAG
jgi:ammonium transporter, Amt family